MSNLFIVFILLYYINMSTRATILVHRNTTNPTDVWFKIYNHRDGYVSWLWASLMRAFSEAWRSHWDLTRCLKKADLYQSWVRWGFEFTFGDHWDTEFMYHIYVDTFNDTVKITYSNDDVLRDKDWKMIDCWDAALIKWEEHWLITVDKNWKMECTEDVIEAMTVHDLIRHNLNYSIYQYLHWDSKLKEITLIERFELRMFSEIKWELESLSQYYNHIMKREDLGGEERDMILDWIIVEALEIINKQKEAESKKYYY